MPEFGTVAVYEEMAKLLNDDPVWAKTGKAITNSFVFDYGAPVSRSFFLNFDEGRVTQVKELPSAESEPADFVISGGSEVWRGVLGKTVNPTVALTRGQLKVKGKLTTLLKNMTAFQYVIDSMTKIPLT